jgi:glucosamine 6-phosphate synthetase-like amidotransferase/phosphosugar isomerase protein
MCGIFGVLRKHSHISGYAGNDEKHMRKLFELLAKQSQNRGLDSTGVMAIRKPETKSVYNSTSRISTCVKLQGQITVYKDNLSAEVFVKSDKFTNLMKNLGENIYALIGHTRSTSGSSSRYNQNNHPHICGNTVGVHNGYIRNWTQLVNKFNLKMKGNCDSEVIFALMDKFMKEKGCTLEEATKETTCLLEGTFACMVASSKNFNKIVVFRRDLPLKIRHRSVGNMLLIASRNEYIRRAFIDVGWEKTFSENYFDMSEYILPNNHGVILNAVSIGHHDWIQRAESFKLSK